MTTVVLGPVPPELEELLTRRRRLGLDAHDEVWEGELHMAPYAHSNHGYLQNEIGIVLDGFARPLGLWVTQSFNLGVPDDHRIPDGAVHAALPGTLYVGTALLVVEVLSPHDESFAKRPFYRDHGVREVLLADAAGMLRLQDLAAPGFPDLEHSGVLGVPVQQIRDAIRWP